MAHCVLRSVSGVLPIPQHSFLFSFLSSRSCTESPEDINLWYPFVVIKPEELIDKKLTFKSHSAMGFLWINASSLYLENWELATVTVSAPPWGVPTVQMEKYIYTFDLRKLFWPMMIRLMSAETQNPIMSATLQVPEKETSEWLMTPEKDFDYLFRYVTKDMTEAAVISAIDPQAHPAIKLLRLASHGEILIKTLPPNHVLPLLIMSWVFMLGFGNRHKWNY
jgi:hypothetical protein